MRSIYLEITHQCNLHCPHCYNRSGLDKEEMKIEVIKSVIQDLVNSCSEDDSCNLAISGGEPLLRSDIKRIIEDIIQHPQINLKIITNGVLLEKIEEFLNESSRIDVQISLDGASERTNDEIRGKGHFLTVRREIQKISQKGFNRCALKMTINKKNCHEVEKFIDFSLEYGFIPRFAFLIKEGNAVSNWNELMLSSTEKITLINEMRYHLRLRKSKITQINANIDIESLVPKVMITCPLLNEDGEFNVVIKPNGEVQPCQGLYDPFFSIGNIREECLNEILDAEKNERIQNLRTFLLSREALLKKSSCKGCIIYEMCQTGCLAQTMSDAGSMMKVDGFCGFRRSMFYANMVKRKGK